MFQDEAGDAQEVADVWGVGTLPLLVRVCPQGELNGSSQLVPAGGHACFKVIHTLGMAAVGTEHNHLPVGSLGPGQ